MGTKDVTPFLVEVEAWQPVIAVACNEAVERACCEYTVLSRLVNEILVLDRTSDSCFRLLPLVILAAHGEQPDRALPICVLSRIWWAGAETLDDVTDGEFDHERMSMSPAQAVIASTACLSLLPQRVIDLYAPSVQIAESWTGQLLDESLHCADGQLRDIARDSGGISWPQTMRIYAGKTGAPYARDAAMAALLMDVAPGLVRGWKAFGFLFGVLRQLANDRADGTGASHADLANGTPTLLLAHAIERSSGAGRDHLLSLCDAARDDLAARDRLVCLLSDGELAADHNARIGSIAGHLGTLINRLAPASDYRDLLCWMIRVSAGQAELPRAAAQ
jgi:hypothetical protein